jgi:hypothetical protein
VAAPILRAERRIREAAGVKHQLLDRDDVLPVCPELRDDVCHPLVQPQQIVLKQRPGGRRYNCLGAREDAIERPVGDRAPRIPHDGRAETPHGRELPVSCDRDLRSWYQALVNVALDACEHGLQPLGVDADIFGPRC